MLKLFEILILVLLFRSFTEAQQKCENFWSYAKEIDQIVGKITFSLGNSADHKLKINLSVASKLSSVKITNNIINFNGKKNFISIYSFFFNFMTLLVDVRIFFTFILKKYV
jgi:hypothetical protein